jgi:hypothetical protein
MFNVYKNQQSRRKISWTDGRTDRRIEVEQYTPLPRGYKNKQKSEIANNDKFEKRK